MPAPSSPTATREGVFTFEDFELDLPAFELRRSGAPVGMEPQVFEVLAFLVENAGRVVTKDEILDRVWPERYVSEASLNSRVMTARKALGDSGAEQRYIKTVHGRGYRFAAPVSSSAFPVRSSVTVLPDAVEALPAPSTSFVGREDELARVAALLEQPGCRLLTIVGPGGIGKTRLALQALQSYPGEVKLVLLEHVEPALLVPALAAALGLRPSTGDTLEQVALYLGGRETLIVLDNVEHLADAARAVLETILARAPGVRFVLTSRVSLGTRQEWVLRLGGLEQSAACQLFAQRLRQANAAVADGEIPEAPQICRLVDGLPLAIELAASLGRFLPPARIRELIEEDASASLRASLRDLPERHRSIESLFAESLRLLSDGERAAMAALAVFDGTFDAAAANAIAGASLATLGTLVDASLLGPHDGRFAMHPLLRQYLPGIYPAEVEDARERHAAYFAELAGRYAGALQGAGQLAAVEAIDPDVPNLFAAWRWAVSRASSGLLARMQRGLITYLIFRSRFIEAEALAGAALEAIDPADAELRSSLLVHHAWALLRLGNVRQAAGAFAESIRISERAELPWKPGYGADARVAVAALELGAGDYPAAFEAARRSLALAEASGDAPGAAFACWLAAAARLRQSEMVCDRVGPGFRARPAPGDTRLDEAAALTARALQLLEGTDEAWLLGYVNIELGLQASMSGDPERACSHFRRAYQLRRSLDDPQGMSSALIYLSDTLVGLGEPAAAYELYPHIRELLLRSGDAQGRAEILRAEGLIGIALGDLDLARRRLREAITVSQSLDFVNNVVGALRGLGEVFAREGRTELSARIMAAVAEHPATTPGSRAHAVRVLAEMDADARFAAQTAPGDFDSLVDEAVRAASPMAEWLRDPAGAA